LAYDVFAPVRQEIMKLILDRAKCTGCKICELACSAKHQQVFSPVKSHLTITEVETPMGVEKRLESCTLCLKCVSICPVEAISFNGKWLITDREKCIGCSQCVDACSEHVIYRDDDGKAQTPDFCEGTPCCIEWCPHQAISLEGEA
jgi:anaerobic carbon-monoxide dehydrogenase iron sulfur subunit